MLDHPIKPFERGLKLGRQKVRYRGVETGKNRPLRPSHRLSLGGIENLARFCSVKCRQVLANDRFEREKPHLAFNLFFGQKLSPWNRRPLVGLSVFVVTK